MPEHQFDSPNGTVTEVLDRESNHDAFDALVDGLGLAELLGSVDPLELGAWALRRVGTVTCQPWRSSFSHT